MNWQEIIARAYDAQPPLEGVARKPRFYPPASSDEIAKVEVRLNARIPASLRSLLLETNGIMQEMAVDGGEWFNAQWLVWTIRENVEQNLLWRRKTEEGWPRRDFRNLVFFADAGCDGIVFAFPVMEDRTCAPHILVWHPIRDTVTSLAPSLEAFLTGWLTGAVFV